MKVRFPGSGFALFACLSLASCSYLAVKTAPEKVGSKSRSELAERADVVFWETFHSGRYEDISKALEVETAAYLADPNDAVTAAHTGWLHIWRLAESPRLSTAPATITDDAVMAHKYFQEAVRLDPTDARYVGFMGSAELAEGSIHRDEKLTRTGYYTLLDGMDAWPEFNLFTAGYVMSNLPAASPRYADALEWQWRTVDLCAETKVSR